MLLIGNVSMLFKTGNVSMLLIGEPILSNHMKLSNQWPSRQVDVKHRLNAVFQTDGC